MGLPDVGEGLATIIANSVSSDEELIALLTNPTKLSELEGVGWFISTKVSDYLSIENGGVKSNLDEVLSLLDKLHLVYEKTAPKSITVGITGGWILSRDELKEHLSEYDIELVEGVRKNISILLTGSGAGQSKIDKAAAKGIKIISVLGVNSINELVDLITHP